MHFYTIFTLTQVQSYNMHFYKIFIWLKSTVHDVHIVEMERIFMKTIAVLR